MKILFIHNYYRSSSPSGEDSVAINERRLLEESGIEIVWYEKHNDDIDDSLFLKKIRLGIEYSWSRRTYVELLEIISCTKPDIAHIHSIHPQISPSAYAACQEAGVPVVHTLHNFRYICPAALLQRDGQPCEECVGRLPLPALRYRCYRDSLLATGALVGMICYNRWGGSFTKLVNRYIALTEFTVSRLIAGGLPAELIEVKPNFLPTLPKISNERKHYAVFVGRLSVEKGVRTLLSAWRSVNGISLKILGDGPLRGELEAQVLAQGINAEFLGGVHRDEVLSVVGGACLQIVPSECYEGFPMVILEAYACGTPVVASHIGSLAEIVLDGETGLHFKAGDPEDLAQRVNHLAGNPELARRMGMKAREIFLEKYTAEKNLKMLMGIYGRAREDYEKRKRH